MKKMNDQDMQQILSKLNQKNESYIAQVWSVVMSINGSHQTALNNAYNYLGITDKNIHIAIIDSFDVSEVKGYLSISLEDIIKVSIKKSLIPSRKIIRIQTKTMKMKISVMSNSIGADISCQKENVQLLIEKLSQYA